MKWNLISVPSLYIDTTAYCQTAVTVDNVDSSYQPTLPSNDGSSTDRTDEASSSSKALLPKTTLKAPTFTTEIAAPNEASTKIQSVLIDKTFANISSNVTMSMKPTRKTTFMYTKGDQTVSDSNITSTPKGQMDVNATSTTLQPMKTSTQFSTKGNSLPIITTDAASHTVPDREIRSESSRISVEATDDINITSIKTMTTVPSSSTTLPTAELTPTSRSTSQGKLHELL